jgi:hypothetical protein
MSLYDDVLGVTKEYMGFAAEEFLARRYKVIIGGDDPQAMKKEDISKLASAIGITAAAYMTEAKAALFKQDVLKLG